MGHIERDDRVRLRATKSRRSWLLAGGWNGLWWDRETAMIDSLFTLYCEACEVAARPSRLWVRAEIEVASGRGIDTHHYLECMNCGFRFKSCMEDHMEAVGEEEWRRCVDDAAAPAERPSSVR